MDDSGRAVMGGQAGSWAVRRTPRSWSVTCPTGSSQSMTRTGTASPTTRMIALTEAGPASNDGCPESAPDPDPDPDPDTDPDTDGDGVLDANAYLCPELRRAGVERRLPQRWDPRYEPECPQDLRAEDEAGTRAKRRRGDSELLRALPDRGRAGHLPTTSEGAWDERQAHRPRLHRHRPKPAAVRARETLAMGAAGVARRAAAR